MKRKSGVKFWASTMTVFFHLAFFVSLAFVQTSGARLEKDTNPHLAVRLNSVEKMLQTSPEAAKPKIRRITGVELKADFARPSTAVSAFELPKIGSVTAQDKHISGNVQTSFPDGFELRQQVVFFGSRSDSRWICYLVDCSGSMSGMFGWVRQQLKGSISRLQQDCYFRIIFFGNDKVFEFGDGNFLRANDKNKSLAYQYIDSVGPAGRANVIAALEKAIQTGDSQGRVIYLLTDGFELTEQNVSLQQQMVGLLESSSSDARINTIGFWPEQQDIGLLQTLAEKTGGEFILITDDYQPEKTQ